MIKFACSSEFLAIEASKELTSKGVLNVQLGTAVLACCDWTNDVISSVKGFMSHSETLNAYDKELLLSMMKV